MIPYPRTGKRVFAPRTGKRSPAVWKRVFAPRTGKRAAFGPRTGKRARAFGPRVGKRFNPFHPYPGNDEVPDEVANHMLERYGNAFDVNQINTSELLQNLQDYKNAHLEDSDEENSNRDLDADEHSSDMKSELVDLDSEEIGMIYQSSDPSFIDSYYLKHPHSN